MSNGLVLIDSYDWIDILCDQEGELGNQVAVLIKNNQIVTTGAIISGLLSVLITEKQQQQINFFIDSVSSVPTQIADWVNATCYCRNLKAGGLPCL